MNIEKFYYLFLDIKIREEDFLLEMNKEQQLQYIIQLYYMYNFNFSWFIIILF